MTPTGGSLIGFRTAGFREWTIDKTLRCLGELGYDAVELCLEHPQMRPESLTEAACRVIADQVREAGLQVASVSYHGDREEPGQRQANQVRALDLTVALGAEILILNTVAVSETVTWQQQYAELSRWLAEELLPEAARRGLTIALELEPGLVIGSSAEMLTLLGELKHPHLAVNLDIGHAWLTDADLPAAIKQLGPAIRHVHWEDFPAGEHRHLVPGEGDMPLADLYGVLQAVGYGGPYVIDLFRITEAPEDFARRSLQATRRMMALAGGDSHVPV